MIKLLSLFSGIGAFEKALENIGIDYELVNYCEIDKFASKSYSLIHNVDENKNLKDVTKVDTSKLPNDIDLVTYGFPCQDISVAGKMKGFKDEQGNTTRVHVFKMGVINMLNAERFKEEILNIVNDDFSLAVNKNNPNEVCKCGSFPCTVCMFSKPKDGKVRCTRNKVNWLLAEYKEPVKLTRFEQYILKYILEKTQYRFIVREKSDNIYIYKRKPKKGIGAWDSSTGMLNLNIFINLFPFIKWEDEEPTSIQEVLDNCEVIENESK